jgi:hydroxymethylpyrimidine/phosphomethylpyrimidine kinase
VDEDGAVLRARELRAAEAKALLIKGGHASGPRSTDILLGSDQEPIRFDTPRLAASMRVTGCMLASAIAAHPANAKPLEDSVREGKLFVFGKLQRISAE